MITMMMEAATLQKKKKYYLRKPSSPVSLFPIYDQWECWPYQKWTLWTCEKKKPGLVVIFLRKEWLRREYYIVKHIIMLIFFWKCRLVWVMWFDLSWYFKLKSLPIFIKENRPKTNTSGQKEICTLQDTHLAILKYYVSMRMKVEKN